MYRSLILSILSIYLCSCAANDMKMNTAMMIIAGDSQNFYKLPEKFQVNKELALLAIEKSPDIYRFLDSSLKDDIEFVKQAIHRNPAIYQLLSDRLKTHAEISKMENIQQPMVNLGNLVVNIESLDGKLYLLKVTLYLELENEAVRREIEAKILQLRHQFSAVLASRKREELVGPEQMEGLKRILIRHANAVLASKKGQVVNIWRYDWFVE